MKYKNILLNFPWRINSRCPADNPTEVRPLGEKANYLRTDQRNIFPEPKADGRGSKFSSESTQANEVGNKQTKECLLIQFMSEDLNNRDNSCLAKNQHNCVKLKKGARSNRPTARLADN